MNSKVIYLRIAGLVLIVIGVLLRSISAPISKVVIALGIIVGLVSFGMHVKNVMSKK